MSTGSVENINVVNTKSNATGETAHSSLKEKGLEMAEVTEIEPSKSGDDDLAAELGNKLILYDACVIEMDIIPLGDTLTFRYLFASEEYDEFVCSDFNDAFAFFISGEGISTKKNMAILDNGARISINSINNGNPENEKCIPQNASFYNKNNGQIALEYDGFTRTLEIKQPVKAFTKYHLKLVIADASDKVYDSGVFIESKSMISYNKKYIIPFNTDDDLLSEKSKDILSAMMEITENHPEYMLEISGHTDSDGSDEYNLSLSENRIEHVVNYISSQGFSDENIIKINRGESLPLTTNKTDKGKETNRRVEIKLIPSINSVSKKEKTAIVQAYPASIKSINPNPVKNNASIVFSRINTLKEYTLIILGLNGKQLKEIKVSTSNINFNVEGWVPGIYNATLLSEGQVLDNKKFVVVR